MQKKNKVAIIGTNGIPAQYGGFETLAENLTKELDCKYNFTVYCSNKQKSKLKSFNNSKLINLPLNANGWQSVLFDFVSTIHAWLTSDVLLILGPSAGFVLPLNRFFKKVLIVNHGGLNEWKREKYSMLRKKLIRLNHKLSANAANFNIVDNYPLKESIYKSFNVNSIVIEYGGDHVKQRRITDSLISKLFFLKNKYDLSVARAQIDNNLHLLLETYVKLQDRNLVLISNWEVSEYGKELKQKYLNTYPNIFIIDSIYDKFILDIIRSNTELYVHSHSRCGTAPSLVEAMNYNIPIICYDVVTNRATTKNKSIYFSTSRELGNILKDISQEDLERIKKEMFFISRNNYKWSIISEKYSNLFS